MHFRPLYFGETFNGLIYLRRYLNEILKLNPPLAETNKFDNDLGKAVNQFLVRYNTLYPNKKLPVVSYITNELYAAVGVMLGEQRLRQEVEKLKKSEPIIVKLLQGQLLIVPVVYSEGAAACDRKIAALFGDVGAEAATVVDIEILNGQFKGRTLDRSDHLYKDGVFHLYTDAKGSDKQVGLFVPKGAKFVAPNRETAGEVQDRDGNWNNDFTFRFDTGKYKGVTVIFVHVAGTYGGQFGAAYLGREFINAKNELTGAENATKTSVQIGYIGGLGGKSGDGLLYRHCHIVVKKNGARIDPRKVFC